MRGHRDLRVIVALAGGCALLALLLPVGALSLLVLAPLAFFLPGYAITSATFARRPLPGAMLGVLSVGLSLAVLALGALPLNWLPGGISAGWWALLLVLVVVAACRGAALRRPLAQEKALTWQRPRPSRGEAALFGCGALSLLAAFVLAFVTLSADQAIGYTELWIEPLPAREAVQVGIANGERQEATYTLEFRVNGRDRPFAVRQVFLDRGARRTLAMPVPTAAGRRDVKVAVTLFRAGVIEPYRRVTAWLPGKVRPPR